MLGSCLLSAVTFSGELLSLEVVSWRISEKEEFLGYREEGMYSYRRSVNER